MKIIFKSLLISLSIAVFALTSCDDKNGLPQGKYASGILVVNEGNFTEADGSIDFISTDYELTSGIYALENEVATSGVFQSLYLDKDRAYMVDQSGSRVIRVYAETFAQDVIWEDDLSTPRYVTIANDKAYVSNWGEFDENFDLPNSFVTVINVNTGETLKTIPTDNGSEGLTAFGGNIYVANSYSNTIQVIDTETDTIISEFEVPFAPTTFTEDIQGKYWVLSSHWLEGAHLSQVDLASEEIIKTFPVAGSSKSLTRNGAGDQIYYLSAPYGEDASVYKVATSATEAPAEPIISATNLYGLGVDPSNGDLYLANHNAFQGNGTVIRATSTGEIIETFPAGRAPNGFVFRK